ncbi:hypothetical protein BJX61DRAFT_540775 [Aspergillus egyptiacus]|nr:hypothetical protein BJX61DRAFT_540775 [Aspergillus egyptiacus]
MSAPPEGTAWFSKAGLKNNIFDPSNPEQFYKYLLIEVALNGSGPRPRHWIHERSIAEGKGVPYKQLNVMYGRNADAFDRAQYIYQDTGKAGKTLEAGFLPVPMPNEDERFLWLDLTYGVRGIYFPICHTVPGPYRDLCKYLRIDFKHRDVSIPDEIAKAQLELVPRHPIQNDTLHPYLRDIPRFNEGILGEKPGAKKKLFQWPSAETNRDKDKLAEWLSKSKETPMSEEQEKKLQELKETSKKYRLERTHKYLRKDVTPTMLHEESQRCKSIPQLFGDALKEFLGKKVLERNKYVSRVLSFVIHQQLPAAIAHRRVKFRDSESNEETMPMPLTMLSDVDSGPDGVCYGRIKFNTTAEQGLGIQPFFTLRFDVKELCVFLAIPSSLRRAQAKDGTGSPDEAPIDLYDPRLVVAFATEDVSCSDATRTSDRIPTPETLGQRSGGGEQYNMKWAINYTSYIKGEFGLNMEYASKPQTKPIVQQWWEFFGQLAAIGLGFIPVVGPMLSFAMYMVTFVATDPSWINGFENVGPAVLGLLVAHKGTMGKYMVKGARGLKA